MPQIDHLDTAGVLDDWINRVANLPHEIAFKQDEIGEKDKAVQECLTVIARHDGALQKWTKANGANQPNPKEPALKKIILENYERAERLQDEKIKLSKELEALVEGHVRRLDLQIKGLQERGEFPHDPDLPSLLRPQPIDRIRDTHGTTRPLGELINSASSSHVRHPSNSRISTNVNQLNGATVSSAPATPAATLLLQRQARESSLGAINKRPRLTGGLGTLPAASSGLARHSSMTPGTPRGGTPSAVRGGSAGPRNMQKKKVAPQGSRQSGAPRKGKPGKSGLSRLKRGHKNSPSSANDSELSDAESGSVEEEEAAGRQNKDADADDDMVDVDDEEGGDDKKYCICHNISYGDMVACDNEDCPYEWFHWSCVGVKSDPLGTWICPVCTPKMPKKV
ncbi:5bd36a5e-2779-43cc-94f6-ba3a6cd05610 [Sclerotinia trifoliorum]|uniref:Chromatin modification-related protein n=1 Tax=Sclerotinia trifoliorum TaxID=28548 RepID=A0A8H2W1Q0_9HELO|nr:5bd36a5e-2779-43cc-94f6-ba3a6cd05610 [Sclerotinia trifoliorum]